MSTWVVEYPVELQQSASSQARRAQKMLSLVPHTLTHSHTHTLKKHTHPHVWCVYVYWFLLSRSQSCNFSPKTCREYKRLFLLAVVWLHGFFFQFFTSFSSLVHSQSSNIKLVGKCRVCFAIKPGRNVKRNVNLKVKKFKSKSERWSKCFNFSSKELDFLVQ